METSNSFDQEIPKYSDYAGFWLRFAASLLDGVILSIASFILLRPLLMIFGIHFPGIFESHAEEVQQLIQENPSVPITDILETAIGMSISDYLIMIFSSTIMRWLYFAIMESSSKQATIGKIALQLQVTDINGNRISFLRATGRHFGKIISGITICIGYIMAGFTDRKQALHDVMANCLVYKK